MGNDYKSVPNMTPHVPVVIPATPNEDAITVPPTATRVFVFSPEQQNDNAASDGLYHQPIFGASDTEYTDEFRVGPGLPEQITAYRSRYSDATVVGFGDDNTPTGNHLISLSGSVEGALAKRIEDLGNAVADYGKASRNAPLTTIPRY